MGKLIKKEELLIFGTSIAFILYIFYFVFPFAEAYDFFNETISPQEDKVFPFFMMTIVVFIIYLIGVFWTFRKVKFLNSINFPLVLTAIFIGVFTSLMAYGGAILWLALFSFPIFIVVLIGSFSVSILFDIRYYRTIKGK